MPVGRHHDYRNLDTRNSTTNTEEMITLKEALARFSQYSTVSAELAGQEK
jgi:hypothetical protein